MVKKSAFPVGLRSCLTTAKMSSHAVLCLGQHVLLGLVTLGGTAEVMCL